MYKIITEGTFKPKVKKDVTLSIRTTPSVKETLQEVAKDNKMTLNDLINNMILTFMMEHVEKED